jgi:hypothetical protein
MSELDMIVMNEKNQTVLDEVRSTIANVDHLESILIQKKKHRKSELERIRKDYDSAIQAYSNVILKLLS